MAGCVFVNCPAPQAGPHGRCLGCSSLLQGARVRDRFTILEVKARSKYSVTYLVTDAKANDAYRLLKELQPISEDNPDFYSVNRSTAERLFEREARVLMTLQNRGIPRLFATFEEEQYCFLVQEYIPGRSLLEELAAKGQGTFREVTVRRILTELAEILQYLHERTPPVVHRDIKPQNLLLADNDRRLLLVDFAAVSQTSKVAVTADSRTVVGSAGYAPPEQLQGRSVPQSDLYAAGASMLRLLTGQHPGKLYHPLERRFIWENQAVVTPSFAEIINGLLEMELTLRTSSAEVLLSQLEVLRPLPIS